MKVTTVFDNKYIKVHDLEWQEGKHYLDASRRELSDIMANMTDEEVKKALPDAVTVCMVIKVAGKAPRLYLTYEYRYPAGRYLLSPPAGLIDQADKGLDLDQAIINTAARELKEETGTDLGEKDEIKIIAPLLFSTPGMTDESNALALVVLNRDEEPGFSQDGAEGSEDFSDIFLLSVEEAEKILKSGRDSKGIPYSVYTWACLSYFVANF